MRGGLVGAIYNDVNCQSHPAAVSCFIFQIKHSFIGKLKLNFSFLNSFNLTFTSHSIVPEGIQLSCEFYRLPVTYLVKESGSQSSLGYYGLVMWMTSFFKWKQFSNAIFKALDKRVL